MPNKEDFKRTGKGNADSLGVSMAVILTWALTTYSGVDIPAEVVAALSGLLGAAAARWKDGI